MVNLARMGQNAITNVRRQANVKNARKVGNTLTRIGEQARSFNSSVLGQAVSASPLGGIPKMAEKLGTVGNLINRGADLYEDSKKTYKDLKHDLNEPLIPKRPPMKTKPHLDIVEEF